MSKRKNICPVCGEVYLRVKRMGTWENQLALWYIHVDLPEEGGQGERFAYCERNTVTGAVRNAMHYASSRRKSQPGS